MRAHVALLGLALLAPAGAAAQWGLGLEMGLARFSGSSRDTSGRTLNGSFRPWVPTLFALGLDRRIHRATLAARVSFASAALALRTDGPTVLEAASLLHFQLAPEIAFPVARLGSGAVLTAHGGPLAELWALEGEDARWRFGGLTGLSLDCALGRRFTSVVTLRLGVTPSIWKAGELPEEFVRQASWRTGVALGLRYGR